MDSVLSMLRRSTATLVTGGLLAVALGPATSTAATVSVTANGTVVQYQAGSGETNAVVVEGTGTQLVITDPGAAISGCPASGVNQVTCTISAGGLDVLFIGLGDRDDRATVNRDFHSVFRGDAGSDVLTGSPGAAGDEMLGGGGRDQLDGRGGGDFIAGEVGGDILRGRAGNDSLDGGLGGDRITGDAGADFLLGGGGNDSLSGGSGIDVFQSLTGADFITSRDGVRERFRCERRDRVTADPADVVTGPCRVTRS